MGSSSSKTTCPPCPDCRPQPPPPQQVLNMSNNYKAGDQVAIKIDNQPIPNTNVYGMIDVDFKKFYSPNTVCQIVIKNNNDKPIIFDLKGRPSGGDMLKLDITTEPLRFNNGTYSITVNIKIDPSEKNTQYINFYLITQEIPNIIISNTVSRFGSSSSYSIYIILTIFIILFIIYKNKIKMPFFGKRTKR